MTSEYQTIQNKYTTTFEPQIQKKFYCGPISSITNKIGGLFLGLVTVGLGTTQVVLSSTNLEKKDWVNIGFGSGFIVLGISKIANTILDYCLWRKQDSQVSKLTENLNVKSGIVIEKDKEILNISGIVVEKDKEINKEKEDKKKLEDRIKIISDKNNKFSKNNTDLVELLRKANKKLDKFEVYCQFDYVKKAIKKAQEDVKTKSSNSNSTQTTPKIVIKEVNEKKD